MSPPEQAGVGIPGAECLGWDNYALLPAPLPSEICAGGAGMSILSGNVAHAGGSVDQSDAAGGVDFQRGASPAWCGVCVEEPRARQSWCVCKILHPVAYAASSICSP